MVNDELTGEYYLNLKEKIVIVLGLLLLAASLYGLFVYLIKNGLL